MRSRPRLGLVFDAVEEKWPSMEFVAEMLLGHLRSEHAGRLESIQLRPRFFRLFEKVPGVERRVAWNADRLVTRFLTYPAQLATRRSGFDLFHVCDHSYAQVAHVLPASRTGVYCHDLDAFACLLKPNGEIPLWRRAMARAQLAGLRRAGLVFYSTAQVREEIDAAGILDPSRLVHAPYGVAPEFWSRDGDAALPPGVLPDRPYLLHVGSSVPRKRLDVLFRVFARVRASRPDLVLVQQGASLLPHQRNLVAELGIGDALVQPPKLSRSALAALYRRSQLVLLTSEREGFGLPILEAIAGGAAVVASDIPAFREVAGEAVTFCPVADLDAWEETVSALLDDPRRAPAPALREACARRYTWTAHADIVANAYLRLAGMEG